MLINQTTSGGKTESPKVFAGTAVDKSPNIVVPAASIVAIIAGTATKLI